MDVPQQKMYKAMLNCTYHGMQQFIKHVLKRVFVATTDCFGKKTECLNVSESRIRYWKQVKHRRRTRAWIVWNTRGDFTFPRSQWQLRELSVIACPKGLCAGSKKSNQTTGNCKSPLRADRAGAKLANAQGGRYTWRKTMYGISNNAFPYKIFSFPLSVESWEIVIKHPILSQQQKLLEARDRRDGWLTKEIIMFSPCNPQFQIRTHFLFLLLCHMLNEGSRQVKTTFIFSSVKSIRKKMFAEFLQST